MRYQKKIGNDLLAGAEAIARELGWSAWQVYRASEPDRQRRSGFPVFRIGARLHARRTTLLEWITRMECPLITNPEAHTDADA